MTNNKATQTTMVTGASRGMGLEFVRQTLGMGDLVFACARHPSRSEGLQALQQEHGDRLVQLSLDVTDNVTREAAYEVVTQHTKSLDRLINNAGINSMSGGKERAGETLRLAELDADALAHMFHVNSIGPLLMARQFADLLAASQRGRVVSISSWLGSISGKSSGANYGYCSSKAALNMLMRTFAFDCRERGILSVLFNPGWVKTDMGGQNAKLTPAESVSSMLSTLDAIELKDTGGFFDWNGEPHEW